MKSALPKVLHNVLGRTILARVLEALDGLGLEHIHIVIGHGADDVKAYLENNPPKTPWSTHLQEPQLGTGHAVMQVVPSLGDFKGTLLATVGDTPLLQGNTLAALLEQHHRDKATVTLLTTIVDDPKMYGRIIRDENGHVTCIVEDKDCSPEQKKIHEINPAIYCLAWPDVSSGLSGLSNNNNQKEYYLTDLVGWASKNKLKLSSSLTKDWREVAGINSRVELAEANRLMRDRAVEKLALESGVTIIDPQSTWISPEVQIGRDSTVLPGCHLSGEITIGENCTIGPHTVMQGPVKIGGGTTVTQSLVVNSEIGSQCRVGPFAHVREGASISDSVRIGNYVEIKKSQFADHTNVSHLSYVGDATLGSGVNIGAGTITANYDHISKKKQKTVIKDGASTGSNSVLVAPITLGEGAVLAAGSVATKDVPDGALAVTRPQQQNKLGWAEAKKRQSKDKQPT
jgi:bifunctional UDP-N-acetylglucosamine pyrophosphorylase/glucosamine-1-phosphate N-acetyltransferase